MAEPGPVCLDHSRYRAELTEHGRRLDVHDQRLDAGEVRMDDLAVGRAENSVEIKSLTDQVAILNNHFEWLVQSGGRALTWFIGFCISGIGVALTIIGLIIGLVAKGGLPF